MIVFDENVEFYWINFFRKAGFLTLSIAKEFAGISDREVVKVVELHKGILITEDKDFGELVFSHGIQNVSVVLLRYDQPDHKQIEGALQQVINDYYKSSGSWFITITKRKVRIRSI